MIQTISNGLKKNNLPHNWDLNILKIFLFFNAIKISLTEFFDSIFVCQEKNYINVWADY